ncbi:hypothetical protein CYMTET_37733 [Cymbomonas tetramitiformis]|uniref:Uncharacterized protein n=1 Tax=Cymbomonas tetramitiformis TaxID=36881 RepID=A0AAE0CDA4_9CHLO|nr:hypothetical protein CYMTET_37733 [Cymbomonas tetramitiformis]
MDDLSLSRTVSLFNRISHALFGNKRYSSILRKLAVLHIRLNMNSSFRRGLLNYAKDLKLKGRGDDDMVDRYLRHLERSQLDGQDMMLKTLVDCLALKIYLVHDRIQKPIVYTFEMYESISPARRLFLTLFGKHFNTLRVAEETPVAPDMATICPTQAAQITHIVDESARLDSTLVTTASVHAPDRPGASRDTVKQPPFAERSTDAVVEDEPYLEPPATPIYVSIHEQSYSTDPDAEDVQRPELPATPRTAPDFQHLESHSADPNAKVVKLLKPRATPRYISAIQPDAAHSTPLLELPATASILGQPNAGNLRRREAKLACCGGKQNLKQVKMNTCRAKRRREIPFMRFLFAHREVDAEFSNHLNTKFLHGWGGAAWNQDERAPKRIRNTEPGQGFTWIETHYSNQRASPGYLIEHLFTHLPYTWGTLSPQVEDKLGPQGEPLGLWDALQKLITSNIQQTKKEKPSDHEYEDYKEFIRKAVLGVPVILPMMVQNARKVELTSQQSFLVELQELFEKMKRKTKPNEASFSEN